MSCADPNGECGEVLDQVYEYLHGELDAESIAAVKAHLEDCAPCLQEFGLEQAVRDLIARSCGCSVAPDSLRQRILTRITEVRVTATSTDGTTTVGYSATTVERNQRR